jgi:hypothetical protein
VTHPSSSATTTVAILGTDALAEDILSRLLEHEGYSVSHLEAHPTSPIEGLLDGVDILLLSPGVKDGAREAFLEAVSTNPKTSAIPVLPLSSALKLALLDELSAGASWGGLFEELTTQIGGALTRAAASAGALVVEGPGAEPPPAAQADAL